MNKSISQSVKDSVQMMCAEDETGNAKTLFEWLAKRSRTASSTSIDALAWNLKLLRWEAVALARALDDAGCGSFKVGRRGSKSRFEWSCNCIQVGKAALGENVDIEWSDLESLDLSDFDDDEELADEAKTQPSTLAELIADAKQMLAERSGLAIDQIEIVIRA